jgi:hypothetical protein
VACGLNLTVVVTVDGRVLQVGGGRGGAAWQPACNGVYWCCRWHEAPPRAAGVQARAVTCVCACVEGGESLCSAPGHCPPAPPRPTTGPGCWARACCTTPAAEGQVVPWPLQMGATGAARSSEKHHPWEGARVPIQVDGALYGHFAEQVACGSHHVAVVASRLGPGHQLVEGGQRCRLLSWGRGRQGQLGLGAAHLEDQPAPQLVQVRAAAATAAAAAPLWLLPRCRPWSSAVGRASSEAALHLRPLRSPPAVRQLACCQPAAAAAPLDAARRRACRARRRCTGAACCTLPAAATTRWLCASTTPASPRQRLPGAASEVAAGLAAPAPPSAPLLPQASPGSPIAAPGSRI